MTAYLLDEAHKLEQRAVELRRQAKQEEEQAAEASKLEVRIRRAVTLPRRVNGMHPAAFDDTRMSTETLDAQDRERPPSIRLDQADALKLAEVVNELRCATNANIEAEMRHRTLVWAVRALDGIWHGGG